ncbi:lipoma-preferred partner isoform X2 [Syngnathoides biaculeatus]|uniref:lipoma-preferred partner isoform X2 n=1 Tax=Syngnathoides biaculeatus TaxID=300417 RepID=UPI002ADE79BE|nr:lipoma-preferred partner isoform X2 [Syngnathoides biaculeatus]
MWNAANSDESGQVAARMETTPSPGSASISVSQQQAPKKFAPVVAPKPKFNPYKHATDPDPAADYPPPPPPAADPIRTSSSSAASFPPPPPANSYEYQTRGPEKTLEERRSSLDAEIDSLTSILADLESSSPYKPRNTQTLGPSSVSTPSAPVTGYKRMVIPNQPPLTATKKSTPKAQAPGGGSSTLPAKLQPVAASYTTASTPSQPTFNVQDQQGYGRNEPQLYQAAGPKKTYITDVPQNMDLYSSGPTIPPKSGAGPPAAHPEDELERLTKKMLFDMDHPPSDEYFGRCASCGENVVGEGTGCTAMDQVFHVDCFVCMTCSGKLRGKPFYAVDKKAYCEPCYVNTLETCSMCSKPIMERILRATGKAYHPHCFTCVVCKRSLDGVPFTVDASNHIHCIHDFHKKFAPRCCVCSEPIMPAPGQEETVRIVALDRDFHVQCYRCEDCGCLLSEGDNQGCYPLDGHVLCKNCNTGRIQALSAKATTDL